MPGWKREWFQDCMNSENHSPFINLIVSSLKSHWVLGSRRGGCRPADVCPVGTTQPYLLSGLCPPKNKASHYSLTGVRGLRGWDLNDSVTNVSRQQGNTPAHFSPWLRQALLSIGPAASAPRLKPRLTSLLSPSPAPPHAVGPMFLATSVRMWELPQRVSLVSKLPHSVQEGNTL